MDARKIENLLRKRCGRIFLGVFAIDRLPQRLPPRRPLLLVCNTDPHDEPGEHWITLFIDNHGEYFDSFGREPPHIFKSYLDKYCTDWIRNDRPLQSVLSSFCGHYCVFYCLYKCLNFDILTIVNIFSNDTALNDYIVHRFVCDEL